MKKNNNKGFTLIELLAVVVIMGILSVVAVSAVNRIMENTRKDTFIDTVKQYTNGAKNMWAADNLKCGNYLSSAVPNGEYYIQIDSSNASAPQLLDDGGKSSWGKRDMKGYIRVVVGTKGTGATETRDVRFYPVITDGVHGVNVTAGATSVEKAATRTPDSAVVYKVIEGANLGRGDLIMTNAGYPAAYVEDSSIYDTIKLTTDRYCKEA